MKKIPSPPVKAPSLTAQAIELVDAGWTPNAASKHLGLKSPSVYRALKLRASKASGTCPCCGQRIAQNGS